MGRWLWSYLGRVRRWMREHDVMVALALLGLVVFGMFRYSEAKEQRSNARIAAEAARADERITEAAQEGRDQIRAEALRRADRIELVVGTLCAEVNLATGKAKVGFEQVRDLFVRLATTSDDAPEPGTPDYDRLQRQIRLFIEGFTRDVLTNLTPIDCDALVKSITSGEPRTRSTTPAQGRTG